MSNYELVDYGVLVRPEQPIRFNEKEYVLRRATSGALAEYKEAQITAVKFNVDGTKQIINSSNLPFKLISVCLCESGTNNPVQIHTLKSWPSDVIEDLFKRSHKLCNLDNDTNAQITANLKKVFANGTAPISLEQLVTWLRTQDTETVEPLLTLLTSETAEVEGKN